jgi:hypothetical protein
MQLAWHASAALLCAAAAGVAAWHQGVLAAALAAPAALAALAALAA